MRFVVPFIALSMAGLPLLAASAENPIYQDENGRLTIPRVDTSGQVGKYQDVLLQRTPQGTFSIASLQTLGQGTLYDLLGITTIEVSKAGTLPASVFIRVSGSDPTCDFAGAVRVHQRREGTRFDIHLSALHINPIGTPQVCTANIRNYKLTVPLEVYGLAAGTYSYTVNGSHTGQFTLGQDNKFADDCDVLRYGNCF
jgi:hypothetical protein